MAQCPISPPRTYPTLYSRIFRVFSALTLKYAISWRCTHFYIRLGNVHSHAHPTMCVDWLHGILVLLCRPSTFIDNTMTWNMCVVIFQMHQPSVHMYTHMLLHLYIYICAVPSSNDFRLCIIYLIQSSPAQEWFRSEDWPKGWEPAGVAPIFGCKDFHFIFLQEVHRSGAVCVWGFGGSTMDFREGGEPFEALWLFIYYKQVISSRSASGMTMTTFRYGKSCSICTKRWLKLNIDQRVGCFV